MDPGVLPRKRSLFYRLMVGILLLFGGGVSLRCAAQDEKATVLRFDATIALNAPIAGTHVVLFVRYWVSSDFYHTAVVWAEPHAGGLNFPIYPPTLNLASDPNDFKISHQFQHMYDQAFSKPIGRRGLFMHRFNVYPLSDIRFAERDALDLRVYASNLPVPAELGKAGSNAASGRPMRLAVRRGNDDSLDELRLLDPNGGLLKTIQYQYMKNKGTNRLSRQTVTLPDQKIKVGFPGQGVSITINGKTQTYSQLKTVHHAGGRKCLVDYRPLDMNGRTVVIPNRIAVTQGTGDTGGGNHPLRSAKLYNFMTSEMTEAEVRKGAEQFSRFDPNEGQCRELLLKYWLKAAPQIPAVDAEILKTLRTHFVNQSTQEMTPGERLKRINQIIQLDWMLGETAQLEEDFQQYMSLLVENDLHQMMLFGGHHMVETTMRWRNLAMSDQILQMWLDQVVVGREIDSILDFAAANERMGRFWTTVQLMGRVSMLPSISPGQRFTAQALRTSALARLYEMRQDTNTIQTEIAIAQALWAFSHVDVEDLGKALRQSLVEARQLYAGLDRPLPKHRSLKVGLDRIEQGLLEQDNLSGSDS